MRVEEVMTRELVTVAPATTLKQAAPLFLEHRVSGLPVVERGRLVGVLSESDIVAKETSGFNQDEVSPAEAAHLQREHRAVTVAEAMTADPVTAQPWLSVWAAADLMIVHDIHRLPIVDAGGALVGLVTRDDLVRAFARSDRDVECDIRERLLPSVGLSPDALDIRVEQGVTTVAGTLDNDVACTTLRATIHLVPGVVQVDWAVNRPGPASQREVVGARA
jgi:CBS domain-containing protein